ncbi:MAG: AAA family ATPase [Muribaculaceae bacterium]|nr:AAA family ATPase [Muribaculaceae bacterium]
MKNDLPISLFTLLFTDYSRKDYFQPTFDISKLNYDLRQDFLIEKDFGGIAVEISFGNLLHDKHRCIRQTVTAYLFDATDRLLLLTNQIDVKIPASSMEKAFYLFFPSTEVEFKSGHSYRLHLLDYETGAYIGEQCFHLFSVNHLGQPEKWYEPCCAGLIADGDNSYLRCCDATSKEKQTYKIRFEIADRIPGISLDIHPEVEVRLYYPASDRIDVTFIEPRYAYLGDFTYYVDIPFHPFDHFKGIYYVELLCMDCPIAGFTFDTDEEIKGAWNLDNILPVDDYDYATVCRRHNLNLPKKAPSENEDIEEDSNDDNDDCYKILEDEFEARLNAFIDRDDSSEDSDSSDDSYDSDNVNLLAELDDLTGLQSVKEKIRVYDSVMRFTMLRAKRGLEMFPTPLHSMFLGSPGTGKTTVAKLMGQMLRRAGILSSGHVIVKERSTLIGQYYSSEGEKTREAIEQAQGGILFIDEAHSLFQPDDPKDPGRFVIESLLTALADPTKDDWMLILAGYPDGMIRLFDINPGFKSRIPDSNIYTFEDFSEEQLMEIAERYLYKKDFTLSPEAKEALHNRLSYDYAHRDQKFGNARHVMNLIQTEILPTMAVRVMNAGLKDTASLSEIQLSDIPMPTSVPTPRRKPIGFTCRPAI